MVAATPASSPRRARSRASPRSGRPGEERDIELHLKLLADAALVGLPNAGKSSLISRLSNARPKVAEYPFTTLQPVLGTVESPDGRQLVLADVPGLIEGASEGVGLGHEFLAHLERARTLIHVIDASQPTDEQWRTIDAELAAYGAGLDERPQIVVLNKLDLAPDPAFTIEDSRITAVFRLSCATGEGVEDFRRRLFSLVPEPEAESRGRGRARRLSRLPAAAKGAWVAPSAHRGRLSRARHPALGGRPRACAACGRSKGRCNGGDRRRGVRARLMIGLFGGAFDPPHRGHVELARRAKAELGLDRLIVVVAADPAHKRVATPADVRLRLARAAFPDDDVLLDGHGRTIDLLRAHPEWIDPVFLIGADQFSEFLTWKEPDDVLELARVGVATRPGFPRERLEAVLAELARPDRVLFFEIEPTPVSSSSLRQQFEAADVPAAVADLIRREALYEPRGYTSSA